MSTFDGVVAEFPDIRIDYFRQGSSQNSRPALANFLSHVHSDHLQGLESCRGPFIWCTPATREILLRLEKYPHRMNFAKGILESRQQTYKHLKKLLKPIPLETPTEIELVPGRSIRVTLLDANHCVGACMFLVEGDGKAILYTGDIRAEVWWVNALTRNPVMLPYACNGKAMPLKQLDTIYLDTTFANKNHRYRHFPTKAEGLDELLQKLSQYPRETEFYIDAWTFGYEDVWQAVSVFLRSQIHVDDYRYGLYNSLANGPEPKAPEAYKLIRAQIGNEEREGCLSTRYRRIHSCERGTGCGIFNNDFVRITPVISRHNGMEMVEAGAGGGHGDMNQQHELEIDDADVFKDLMSLCVEKLHGQPKLLSSVVQMLTDATSKGGSAISLQLADLSIEASINAAAHGAENDELEDVEDLPLEKLVSLLAKRVTKLKSAGFAARTNSAVQTQNGLPKQITFPYSRHASYGELCILVEALMPRNIYPCTVDKSNWGPQHTMSYLFGHLYTAPQTFGHDTFMLQHYKAGSEDADSVADEQQTEEIQFQAMETQLSAYAEDTHLSAYVEDTTQSRKRRGSDEEQQPIGAKCRKRSHSPRQLSPKLGSNCTKQQLYIRYFPYKADRRDILEFFRGFDVENVHIPTSAWNGRHSTGFAFVEVPNIAEGLRAIRELDGKSLLDSIVCVELVKEERSRKHGSVLGHEDARSQRQSSAASPKASNNHARARWTEPSPQAQSAQRNLDQRELWQQRIATSLEIRSDEQPVLDAGDAEKTYLDAGSPWGNAEGTRKSLTTELSVPDMIKGRLTASRRRSMVASRPTTSSRSRTPTVQNKDYGRLSPPPDDDVEIKQELDLTSDQMKEALQRSAYDAVLSNNSKEWCLVSVDGHNTKESELPQH